MLIIVLESKHGISGLALELFKNYIRNTSVQILAAGSVLEVLNIPFSLPQESCAGPGLYIPYICTYIPAY